MPKSPRGASCSAWGAEGTFTSLGSGLPLCRAWPGAPREGRRCCLSTARLTNCFLPLWLGWPIWLVSRGLEPQQCSWCWGAQSQLLCAETLPDPAWLFKQILSPGLVSPALGAPAQAGPWSRQAHHGGLFQGLGFMAKAREMLVSAIRHHKSPLGNHSTKQWPRLRPPQAPAPGGNSPLGLVSGFWLRNVIYYGSWIMPQDCPGSLQWLPPATSPPRPRMRAEAGGGTRGTRRPESERAGASRGRNWPRAHAAGSAGRLARPLAGFALFTPCSLHRAPDARSEWHRPKMKGTGSEEEISQRRGRPALRTWRPQTAVATAMTAAGSSLGAP